MADLLLENLESMEDRITKFEQIFNSWVTENKSQEDTIYSIQERISELENSYSGLYVETKAIFEMLDKIHEIQKIYDKQTKDITKTLIELTKALKA